MKVSLFIAAALSAHALANPVTSDGSSLERRAYGLWIDVFTDGWCNSGKAAQPISGWAWDGQCKNLKPGIYGAQFGDFTKGAWENCKVKFWQNQNCHGLATVFHPNEHIRPCGKVDGYGSFKCTYDCMAVANDGNGNFHIPGGAASVQITC
ncbi:uncharacterized protein TRIVIDRAFT_151784 [Trichoderma virens Gv29-8]|uniref:Uncharacterized protein n=1 Tax=Hypocrea virens (strain Gv29-8 / FGSC 10586) TaxID=413071 RepID=G9MUT2_HYPVG|nr:uncharacterized protein TRIVIDRAFT_151784 [Trichoderma virens Gv29-8]EHK21792.1 hypothetical protein TRIVIDRAFT_151784 [Trichoderma virens Gv29-8]